MWTTTGANHIPLTVSHDEALCSIELLLEEVKILQMHLDVAKDEEERRALQEDITGKVRWLTNHEALCDSVHDRSSSPVGVGFALNLNTYYGRQVSSQRLVTFDPCQAGC